MSTPIVDRVRKLLALAERAGSPAEAATAAARAQELIIEHRLAEADLAIAGGQALPEESVVEDTVEDGFARRKAQAWRVGLAGALAPAFGCRIYYYQGTGRIQAIGRESDVQALRYIQGYLGLEIQRMTEVAWTEVKARCDGGELPQPTRWRNSFRLGAVSTVRQRLKPAKPLRVVSPDEAPPPEATAAAQALVLQRDAVAQAEVDRRWKDHFPREGRGGGGFRGASHSDGYHAGRAAGEKLDLDRRSRGAIEGSKPRLK